MVLASVKRRVLDAFHASPHAIFVVLMVLHGVMWTLWPWVGFRNLPLDVVEGYVWGRSIDLGVWKHPPLVAWILGASERLFSDTFKIAYLYSQICVIATFTILYLFGGHLFGWRRSLLAVFLLEGMFYLNTYTPAFNADTVAFPLLALLPALSWLALHRNDRRLWALVGVAAGGAIYAKYVVVLMFASVFAWILWTPWARRSLVTRGPWIALGIGLLVAGPHLWWLLQTGGGPLQFPLDRPMAAGFWQRVITPVHFIIYQLGHHAGTAILALIAFFPARKWLGSGLWEMEEHEPSRDSRAFLLFVGLGPLLLSVMFIILQGLIPRQMWGAPLFVFSGLLVVSFLPRRWTVRNVEALIAVIAVLLIVLPIGNVINQFVPNLMRPHWFTAQAVEDMAKDLTREFERRTGRCLNYVIGDFWFAGNVALYGTERAQVIIDGDPLKSRTISLDEVAHDGALVVWRIYPKGEAPDPTRPDADMEAVNIFAPPTSGTDPRRARMRELLIRAERMPPRSYPWAQRWPEPPMTMGWAIIHPTN